MFKVQNTFSDELNDCICGSKPIGRLHHGDISMHEGWVSIDCPSCELGIFKRPEDRLMIQDLKKKLIERWNSFV